MTVTVETLPAAHGDCIFVKIFSSNSTTNILIDGGTRGTYGRALRSLLGRLDKLDAVILTHVDNDHIGGLISFLQDKHRPHPHIECVYINTPRLIEVHNPDCKVSIGEAITFEACLKENGIAFRQLTTSEQNITIAPSVHLTTISPDTKSLNKLIREWKAADREHEFEKKISISRIESVSSLEELAQEGDKFLSEKEDYINASSIAFLLHAGSKRLLFLGDSHPKVIMRNMQGLLNDKGKLSVDLVKLSHHGSITSISMDVIKALICNNFIISTNGGSSNHLHPSRECLAKLALICDRGSYEYINFYTNYPVEDIVRRIGPLFTELEKGRHKINLEFRRAIQLYDN